MPHGINDFLVIRDIKNESTMVLEFGETLSGLKAFESLEWYFDCTLLGSDSVETLKVTHPGWFRKDVMVIKT